MQPFAKPELHGMTKRPMPPWQQQSSFAQQGDDAEFEESGQDSMGSSVINQRLRALFASMNGLPGTQPFDPRYLSNAVERKSTPSWGNTFSPYDQTRQRLLNPPR